MKLASDKLPVGSLNHIERNCDTEQRDQIWDQKYSSSTLVAEIGKSPDITKTNGIPDAREPILDGLVECVWNFLIIVDQYLFVPLSFFESLFGGQVLRGILFLGQFYLTVILCL